MTAHHGRNSAEDVYTLGVDTHVANIIRTRGRSANIEDTLALGEPARCHTASRGRDGASGDQTFALGVLPIQDADRPRLTTRSDHAVFAFDYQQLTSMENRSTVLPDRPAPTITKNSQVSVAGPLRPRRLTPREVERCFGFVDDYTLIKGASDSARYEALGNSMAVPVMRWIGKRLIAVDAIVQRGSLAAA